MIYHIVSESELQASVESGVYRPASLARDGFVHCAAEPSVLPVANDFYADVTARLFLLEVDPGQLSSETRYEAAAPIAGAGAIHLETATRFPHVYGPIELDAVTRVGVLTRTPDGFRWPTVFWDIHSLLSDAPPANGGR